MIKISYDDNMGGEFIEEYEDQPIKAFAKLECIDGRLLELVNPSEEIRVNAHW